MDLRLVCSLCGEEKPITDYAYRCSSCGYPLEVEYDLDRVSEAFNVEDLADRRFDL